MPSRHLASLVALGLLLTAGVAHAQGAPTPGAALPPLPPGFAYAPPGMPYQGPPPGFYAAPAYTPMKRKSAGLLAGGITLVSLGSVGLILGTSLYVAGTKTTFDFPPCAPDTSECG